MHDTDGHSVRRIVDKAWDEAIRLTVNEIIRDAIGYGVDSEIKAVIKAHAERMLDSDAELQEMIRDALRSWINDKTADDYRKQRDKNRARFTA